MCIYYRPLKNGNIQEFVFELDRNKFELISPIDVNFRFTVYEKFIVFDINTLNKSNQGYGTALISIVLEYAKENKFDFVAGHLARADFENGNWKKSIDFYLHRLSTAFLIKSDLFMRDLYPQYENTQDFFDRFWSFTSESQRFLCVLLHLLTRVFPRLFRPFSCQFQIINRTKKEAKDLWSNASFFIFSLTFQENFHSKIRTILENRGRR